MNPHFSIRGKCSICNKTSVCKQLICENFQTKCVFMLTSKLKIDLEKYDKLPVENRLICIECYGKLLKCYRIVENKFYETINLASTINLDTELKKYLCCLCKQQYKKVLKPIESNIWVFNQKLMKKRFDIDFETDGTSRNACLKCYHHLLFVTTFYNTINNIQTKSTLEILPEELENIITDFHFEEPRQGTSAIRNLKAMEVVELYRRDENDDSVSSSCHFLMADQLKFAEKEHAEAAQTRFSKFWRRFIKKSSNHSSH